MWTVMVILAVAGSTRTSPAGVSTHTASRPEAICGVSPGTPIGRPAYSPMSTGTLSTGFNDLGSIKVMPATPPQPIQTPCGPGDATQRGPDPGMGASFAITLREGSIL